MFIYAPLHTHTINYLPGNNWELPQLDFLCSQNIVYCWMSSKYFMCYFHLSCKLSSNLATSIKLQHDIFNLIFWKKKKLYYTVRLLLFPILQSTNVSIFLLFILTFILSIVSGQQSHLMNPISLVGDRCPLFSNLTLLSVQEVNTSVARRGGGHILYWMVRGCSPR